MSYSTWLSDVLQMYVIPLLLPAVEQNWVPDPVLRTAIRRELAGELYKIAHLSVEDKRNVEANFVNELKSLPIAIAQQFANSQHYEVPAEFYKRILGPNLKYSCCYFTPNASLKDSEVAMLELYCERAQLVDGMRVLDLGCGWGSLALYLAAKYPNSAITALSNSSTQRDFIVSEAAQRQLTNLTVITADIASYEMPKNNTFDRILSIEMMEHMKNYNVLFEKLSRWLAAKGKLFVHIFVTRHVPQHYDKGWMSETFFTGGTLPSDTLLLYFQQHLAIEGHWRVNGKHYQQTLEGWLTRLDAQTKDILPIFAQTYGDKNAVKWLVNWRLFLIASAEFFGMNDGEEYFVSHYLFSRK